MPNLYAFFIALGLALLKENGKISYIIPQTILTAGDLDVLRYHLSKHSTIEKIITFDGNLFVGRGLKQNKPVATSSLIFIARKKKAKENHRIKIINYKTYDENQGGDFEKYFNSRNKEIKSILQNEILEKVENWNFIKWDSISEKMLALYNQMSDDINVYYEHNLAKKCFGDTFWFDRGIKFEKDKINIQNADWFLIKKDKSCFNIQLNGSSIASEYIVLPHGSQGLELFENKYKIIWNYMNFDKFYFSDRKIMIDFNWIVISSNNKYEILFLLAILNANLSLKLFALYLRNQNEQAILLGIKSIKQYIRVPKITKRNQVVKDEIVKQTEKMLSLEYVLLKDVVDFSKTSMQKLNTVSVIGDDLVLTKEGKEYKLPISRAQARLVSEIIHKEYKQGLINDDISISELKVLPAIDFAEQTKIKDYIDDLVFALYFNIDIKNIGLNKSEEVKELCRRSEFYKTVTQ